MAGRIFEPLTEEETRQLHSLLMRYLAHHVGGLMSAAFTALRNKISRDNPKLIEPPPPDLQPSEPPKPPP